MVSRRRFIQAVALAPVVAMPLASIAAPLLPLNCDSACPPIKGYTIQVGDRIFQVISSEMRRVSPSIEITCLESDYREFTRAPARMRVDVVGLHEIPSATEPVDLSLRHDDVVFYRGPAKVLSVTQNRYGGKRFTSMEFSEAPAVSVR
jgi:hypothetical protein